MKRRNTEMKRRNEILRNKNSKLRDTNVNLKNTATKLRSKNNTLTAKNTELRTAKAQLIKKVKRIERSFGYRVERKLRRVLGSVKRTILSPVHWLKNGVLYITNREQYELQKQVLLYDKAPIENAICFLSFKKNYAGNAKYLCKELIKRKFTHPIYFVIDADHTAARSEFPKDITVIYRKSLEYYKVRSTSKIVIDNAFMSFMKTFVVLKNGAKFTLNVPKKKEGQIFLNTWHGSLGFKKVGARQDLPYARRSSLETDYMISNSDFESQVYRTTYWPGTKIEMLGHPRLDTMFLSKAKTQQIKNKVTGTLTVAGASDLSAKDNFILFAPTRISECDIAAGNTTVEVLLKNWDTVAQHLKDKFGKNYKLITKLHPNNLNSPVIRDLIKEHAIDATAYGDIYELMVASDIGITDYSSWLCDLAFSRKPGFIFCTKLPELGTQNYFYDEMGTTPFMPSFDIRGLNQKIDEFEPNIYCQAVEEFLDKKGAAERGKSAKHNADFITKLLQQ